MNMRFQSGFTLIESLVVVSIIGILTSMSLVAIPGIRAHQQLVADTESIRALLLDAKQRTLNQVRPEDCLRFPGIDLDDPVRTSCSDVGVALDGTTQEIIQFADTNTLGLHTYNAERPGVAGSGDHVITRARLSSKIEAGSATSLLFVGVPPSAELYKDGDKLVGGEHFASITLTATNGSQRTIKVYSFGTVDIQ